MILSFYINKYVPHNKIGDPDTKTAIARTEEVDTFIAMLSSNVVPTDFPLGKIEAKYLESSKRVQIRFWSKDGLTCHAVHFENGYHVGAEEQDDKYWTNVVMKFRVHKMKKLRKIEY